MQEKFSLALSTFLRQLLKTGAAPGNSSCLQCFCAVPVCRRERILWGGLSCGTFITDQHLHGELSHSQPASSSSLCTPTALPGQGDIPQSACRKWGDSVRAAAHTSESLTSVNKCVTGGVWAFLWVWGDLGFSVMALGSFPFVVLGFVLLWVVFTTRYSLHLRIILHASETM